MEIHDDGRGAWPVLILGDSWARYRRLDDGVRAALAPLDPRIVSLGLTGYSSGALVRAWPKLALPLRHYELAILMVGVNDAFQHLGAKAYARGVARLAAMMPASRVMVVELPPITGDQISSFAGRMKHRLYRFLFEDGGDTVSAYRAALRGVELLEVGTFPMKLKDGVHLTDEGFARFGRFLGAQIRERLRLEHVLAS